MKKFISCLCVLFALLIVLLVPVEAARAYQTYTYSIDGQPLYSPDAYTPEMSVNSTTIGLGLGLNNASDMVVDKAGNNSCNCRSSKNY